jgi:hypothetical protein
MTWEDAAAWSRRNPARAEWLWRHFLGERAARCWQLYRHRNGLRLWAADRAHAATGLFAEGAAEAQGGLRWSAAYRAPHGYAPHPMTQANSLARLSPKNLHKLFGHLHNYRLGVHLAYARDLAGWARERRTDLVLVDMPVSEELEERFHPKEFARYRAALEELRREHGLPVLRATRADVGLARGDFADLIHLNAQGADKLGRWLRRRLEELGAPDAPERFPS